MALELPELPQVQQHPDLRDWAERLVVALKQEQEALIAANAGQTVTATVDAVDPILAAIQMGMDE